MNTQNTYSFLPQGCDTLESYTDNLLEYLQKFSFLYQYIENNKEERVIDFLVHDHWNKKVPSDWQSILLSLDMEQLINMPSGYTESHWPSTLKECIQRAQELVMPYRNFEKGGWIQQTRQSAEEKLLVVGMKQKKRYEVEMLTNFILQFAEQCETDSLVDIGCGKGYLSQALAMKQASSKKVMDVFAIDCNEMLVHQCQERVDKIERTMQQELHYYAINSHLSLSMSQNQFYNLMKPLIDGQSHSDKEWNKKILMISLHSCGDLSSTMLKLFLKSDAKSMINIGCCYHKLTEHFDFLRRRRKEQLTDDEELSIGFPLSQKLKHFRISNAGKILACYATLRWKNTKENEEEESEEEDNSAEKTTQQCKYLFKMHSFRCCFQFFITDIFNTYEDEFTLGRIPKKSSETFGGYATYAVEKLLKKMQSKNKNNEEMKEKMAQMKKQFEQWNEEKLNQFYTDKFGQFIQKDNLRIKTVECFWSLRAVLGPVIESIILVDRIWYLRENGIPFADVIRLFDPKISPRSLVVIASKVPLSNGAC